MQVGNLMNKFIALNSGQTYLKSLPLDVKQLKYLQEIEFTHLDEKVDFLEIFEVLKQLPYLNKIIFKYGYSNSTFRGIENLQSLKELHITLMSSSGVFPKGITKLKNLEGIVLGFTDFKDLPVEITQLRNLKLFSFGQFNVDKLKNRIEELKKLMP